MQPGHRQRQTFAARRIIRSALSAAGGVAGRACPFTIPSRDQQELFFRNDDGRTGVLWAHLRAIRKADAYGPGDGGGRARLYGPRWHGLRSTAYFDRAAPRRAPPKLLALAFTRGPFIELVPGSNCPGWICWTGWSAPAFRFLAFCAAFAFARWRALALVISASPFLQSVRRNPLD